MEPAAVAIENEASGPPCGLLASRALNQLAATPLADTDVTSTATLSWAKKASLSCRICAIEVSGDQPARSTLILSITASRALSVTSITPSHAELWFAGLSPSGSG